MKKLFLFLMICLIILLLAVPTLAQEPAGQTQETPTTPATPTTPSPAQPPAEDTGLFYPAFRNIDVVKLNENQMALLMINNQIEYLMLQIKEKDNQINSLNAGFEDRLKQEREELAKLKTEHAGKIAELEEKLLAKEGELEAGRQELHALEKRVAAFLGDSGIYLVALMAALAGLVLGLILSSIVNWRRNHPPAKTT